MFLTVNNTNPIIYNLPKQQEFQNRPCYRFKGLTADTVSFSGKSPCEYYKSVFDFMLATLLDSNKSFRIDGSLLSASNIDKAVAKLFDSNSAYKPYQKSSADKIKWKSYIPEDVRVFSIDKINEARKVRMQEWKNFLQNPDGISLEGEEFNPELAKKIKENPSLKFIIWQAVTSELKANNRHIPVPFNETALLETIESFESISAKDRTIRCANLSFLEVYTHRLRDNLLMDLGLSGDKPVWVRIPALSKSKNKADESIKMLEILSCRNWCTRSAVDKARAALEDGDFYIYLKRGKSELWEPLIGMTTSKGKIDQIQGVENNNIIPLGLVNEVESFIKSKNLQCCSGIIDEGPKARQAILISKKLNMPVSKEKPNYNFAKAIKEDNVPEIYRALNIPAKQLEDGMFEIGSYRPTFCFDATRGITVPYEMFGLSENNLLKNVRKINGDLVLDAKQEVFNSRITEFPPNLETVTGRIICSKEQYDKFKPAIDRIVGHNKSKLIIHDSSLIR